MGGRWKDGPESAMDFGRSPATRKCSCSPLPSPPPSTQHPPGLLLNIHICGCGTRPGQDSHFDACTCQQINSGLVIHDGKVILHGRQAKLQHLAILLMFMVHKDVRRKARAELYLNAPPAPQDLHLPKFTLGHPTTIPRQKIETTLCGPFLLIR